MLLFQTSTGLVVHKMVKYLWQVGANQVLPIVAGHRVALGIGVLEELG